jgi:hypothetical protein
MKSEKQPIPRLFELWYEITGEGLWNDEKEKEGENPHEKEVSHERR